MLDEQAAALALRLMGQGAVAKDRLSGENRYAVAPAGYLDDVRLPHWHLVTGPTWEDAFTAYSAAIVEHGLAPLAAALSRYSFVAHDEHRLYLVLEEVFSASGHRYVREHRLDEKSRLDFWFPDLRVAIEVKVGGKLHDLRRQIERYAEHPQVGGILVVSTLAKLTQLPDTLADKPVRACRLAGPFG